MCTLYNELIKTIQLQELNIKELTMNSHVNVENVEGINARVGVGVEIEDFNESNLEAVVIFDIEALDKDNENQKVFEIGFVYLMKYSIDELDLTKYQEDEKEKTLEIFVRENIPINIWPFARELVAEMTRRMGFPPFMMGMYRFFPNASNKKSDKNDD